MNEAVSSIIQLMRSAVPPDRPHLDQDSRQRLRDLTRLLVRAKPGAMAEHDRFLSIAARGLELPDAELARRGPARLVSVSRGPATGWPRQEGAEYRQLDIRDLSCLAPLVAEIRPDVIFHAAAQRDPGLRSEEH